MPDRMKNVSTLYRCDICGETYTSIIDAMRCANQKVAEFEGNLKVGDIVTRTFAGFNWYDGDEQWIAETVPDGLMGFYYVITHIHQDKHQMRYHVATKAMENAGYRLGITGTTHLKIVRATNVPDYVELTKEEMIGMKAQKGNLLW